MFFLIKRRVRKAVNKRIKKKFTLIEIILAILIFSIIMTLVSMSLYSVQKTYEKVDKFNARLDQYQSIDRFCDTVIKNMVPFKWQNRDSKKIQQVFKGENNEMFFAYLHRINDVEEGALRFVKIYLEDEKVKIKYRKYPLLHWDESDIGVETEIIAKDVDALNFLYVDTKSGGQYDIEWNDSWNEDSNPNIPLAVQIKIKWKSGKSEVWLRRVAASSRYSTHGIRQTSNSKK
ncbi:hypothetical protein AAEX28_00385 [Lentisphaerota bacterium WC36G]|nr:hypothetical protein LJT99_03265 [Lentisphaerae bacterium WC36]